MLFVVRRRPTRPAACHVVPPPSSFCSSSNTSFQPSLARWYAMLHPTMPPPTMMTWVWVGRWDFTSDRDFTRGQIFHNALFRGVTERDPSRIMRPECCYGQGRSLQRTRLAANATGFKLLTNCTGGAMCGPGPFFPEGTAGEFATG